MKTTIRLGVLALAGVAALAFAGSALAAYTPKLTVRPASFSATGVGSTISVTTGQADDPTARLVIYAPQGYTVTTGQGAGTSLGTVTASVVAADLGGTLLPLTGTVDVYNPSDPNQNTVAPSVVQCTGTATHTAIWVLTLQAAGQTLRVPVAVDTTTGAEATFSSTKLTICLPPPDVPAGTPGRATFGAKLVSANMVLSNITNPTANGSYTWRSIFTPYSPGTGRPNAAATVEAQSTVALPTRLTSQVRVIKRVATVRVKVKGKTVARRVNRYFVSLNGLVTRGTAGVSGVRLTVVSSPRLRCSGRLTTGAAGTGTATCGAASKGRAYRITVRATLRELNGACVAPLPGTAGCLSNTFAGVTLSSTTRTVRIPRR